VSRWDDKDDWDQKSDREVLEDIDVQLRASGLAREDHDVLPLGGARGRLGSSIQEVKDRFGWIVRDLGYRLRGDQGLSWRTTQADCAALGLIVEEPSAVALKWLFERLHTELAIDMAKYLRRGDLKFYIWTEVLKERTKADVDHHGARCGELERYFRYGLWVADPDGTEGKLEVWHWHRSIAAGEYNYRASPPEYNEGTWSEEVEPGWWNWENTPPTDLFTDYGPKEKRLCEVLLVTHPWPPELIRRSDVVVPEDGGNGGPYR
jgi:hypothetical protein